MTNKARIQKITRLKTCFTSIENYMEQLNNNPVKKLKLVSQPSSSSHQYRSRTHTSKMQQRSITHQQWKKNSKIQHNDLQQQNKQSNKGCFDVLRVKIHSNERYNKKSIESSVVNRKNFKNYLKVQVQKQYNRAEYPIKGKTAEKQLNKSEDSKEKQMINNKIQEIIRKFAKSHTQSSYKDNPLKTIFQRRENFHKNIKSNIFSNKNKCNFNQNSKINPFFTIVGWQIQPIQEFQQKP